MRTVSEIVEAAQEQQPATDEELRLALLCVYYALQLGTASSYETDSELILRARAKANFESMFHMMRTDPTVRLGRNWTPGTPENTAQRAQSKRILAGFEKRRERDH